MINKKIDLKDKKTILIIVSVFIIVCFIILGIVFFTNMKNTNDIESNYENNDSIIQDEEKNENITQTTLDEYVEKQGNVIVIDDEQKLLEIDAGVYEYHELNDVYYARQYADELAGIALIGYKPSNSNISQMNTKQIFGLFFLHMASFVNSHNLCINVDFFNRQIYELYNIKQLDDLSEFKIENYYCYNESFGGTSPLEFISQDIKEDSDTATFYYKYGYDDLNTEVTIVFKKYENLYKLIEFNIQS